MLGRYRDVFRSFNAHEVRYLVLGGLAAAIHGVPRATFDIDLLIEPTRENVARLLEALRAIDFPTADMTTVDKVLQHEITIFKDRVRLDVITKATGLTFDQAWPNRLTMHYEGQAFYLVSRDDLLQSKRAAGRRQDLEDVRALEHGEDVPH